MHYVYVGYEEALNRRSFDTCQQLYVIKFGYCEKLDTWEDRFNDGYKNKETGARESLPLALCTGWRRIATVEAGEWRRATQGIEKQLREWAAAAFGMVALMPVLKEEVATAHERWKPSTSVNGNGLGELRHVPFSSVPNLAALMRERGINDPLADDVVEQMGRYLEDELRSFAISLGLFGGPVAR